MTKCECPLAGYCERHRIQKTEVLHRLCQTRENYFNAWENGNGPGRTVEQTKDEREERKKRIAAKVAKDKRVLKWVEFFRIPEDKGLGDTAHRLNMRACKNPDAHRALEQLLRCVSCKRADAVLRLNAEHPYPKA